MTDEITLDQLWEMLTLTDDGAKGGGRLWSAPDQAVPEDRVFGGLLLAQGVVAAGQGLPDGFTPVAVHADFLSGVPTDGRNTWHVTPLGEAPSLVGRRATLVDGDGEPLFAATVRFGRERSDLPSYEVARPREVVGPESLLDLADRYSGEERVPAWWRIRRPVDLRHVETPVFLEPAAERRAEQSLWWRVRGEVVGDPLRAAAVIAYASDMSLVEPVFRGTGTARHAPGSRILSLTHSIVFHALPDLTDWMQMDVAVPRLAHGRGHGVGEVFAGGQHIASLSQLALVKLA